MQVIEETCSMLPQWEIQEEELVEAHVHKLAIGVCDARPKMARVQLELNLKIIEFQLKAQPSSLSEFKEQHTTIVTIIIALVDSAVVDCMQLFE